MADPSRTEKAPPVRAGLSLVHRTCTIGLACEGLEGTANLNTEPQIWLHSAWETTEKAPPRERGLKWGQSFLTKGLAAGRSQRHRQDDMGSGIGGATEETPSRAIGFCGRAADPRA
jgi:hypothetical protein